MRQVSAEQITELVADLCIEASFKLPTDVTEALERAAAAETSPRARWILGQILENAQVAESSHLPICQDTGMVACFVRLGRAVRLTGDLCAAVDAGVRRAYTSQPLRRSILADPLKRDANTGDNTPAVVHLELVDGDGVEIAVIPKGGGSENAGAVWMLSPAEGEDGVVARVVGRVLEQGGKWCPPGILGVGVGGTMEHAVLLAKSALLRPTGRPHPEQQWADLERRLVREINATGIGPMGLGGDTTVLAVHVEYYPCHLASLPVAACFQCHAARRAMGAI
jgi:fumarate hydratase subunit alpha